MAMAPPSSSTAAAAAAAATDAPSHVNRDTGHPLLKMPSNPTPLSATQEAQVREIYYKNARAKCGDEIAAFAACTQNRTLSMGWACRAQKLTMNSCLLSYQGQDELDKARMQWFQEAGERKRAREEREIKAAEALKKHREYWGIEDTEARLKKEREEKERRRVERAREEREEQLRREMDARKKGWGR